MLKFFTSLISVVVVFFSSAFVVNSSGHGELAVADDLIGAPYNKTFTITAYYSPLPCQSRYATGSYEADIRLNGNGTNGADGTEVYPGMVAAPKSYSFGTKMNIPGIGLVAVHDRGGAIVASSGVDGVYDRLDVWMGFGDIGLKRALEWGKRTVDVTVYGVTDAVQENMQLMGFSESESIPANCESPNVNVPAPSVQNDYQKPIVKPVPAPVVSPVNATSPFLGSDLRLGVSGSEVVALQENLSNLNLFRGEITGFYGEVTAHAVFKFQQINGLVLEANSPFAGVFGSKTRAKMNDVIASKLYVSKKIVKVDTVKVENVNTLSFGMTGSSVTDLQLFLRNNGYFDGAFLTEYFGNVTREAVIKFQLHEGIITSRDDQFAGVVGPATLEAIRKMSQ